MILNRVDQAFLSDAVKAERDRLRAFMLQYLHVPEDAVDNPLIFVKDIGGQRYEFRYVLHLDLTIADDRPLQEAHS